MATQRDRRGTRMTRNITNLTVASLAALSLAGCADGSTGLLSTASLNTTTPAVAAAAPQTDPGCIALTARIDALRKDGVVERVEKASTGKSKTVSVKRDSLAKMAELDKSNAEFQAKCALPLTSASARPASPVQAALTTAAQSSAVQSGAVQQAKATATTAAVNAAQKMAKP